MAKYPFMVKRNGRIYPAGVEVPTSVKEKTEAKVEGKAEAKEKVMEVSEKI